MRRLACSSTRRSRSAGLRSPAPPASPRLRRPASTTTGHAAQTKQSGDDGSLGEPLPKASEKASRSLDGRYPASAWRATRDRTGPPAYGNGRPGDLRRLRNRPGFLNYRGEPAQSSAVTLARGTATAATLLSQHMQVPSGTEHAILDPLAKERNLKSEVHASALYPLRPQLACMREAPAARRQLDHGRVF